MISKNRAIFPLLVAVVIAILQQGHQVRAALIDESKSKVVAASAVGRRGLRRNSKDSKDESSKPNSNNVYRSQASSNNDEEISEAPTPPLCIVDFVQFNPYNYVMSRDPHFTVRLIGVESSTEEKESATNKAKTSLKNGLIEYFQENSMLERATEANGFNLMDFDPSVDITILDGEESNHSKDIPNFLDVTFDPPLFLWTIEYDCTAYANTQSALQKLALILDVHLTRSVNSIFRNFMFDFRNSKWSCSLIGYR